MTTTPITGALVVIVGAAGIAAGALFLQADDTTPTPTAVAGGPAVASAPADPGGGGYGSSAGAAGAGTDATGSSEASGASGATLEISGFQFGSVSVVAGGQVAVANRDSATHTVTATGGAFDTGQISGGSGDSFVAPDAPGSYPFRCQIHPDMSGTLTVG